MPDNDLLHADPGVGFPLGCKDLAGVRYPVGMQRKDTGRVPVTLFAEAIAGVAAAALVQLTPVRNGVAGNAGASHVVTAGKTLRLQALSVSTRANATGTAWARFAVRWNPSGAVTATSPILCVVEVAATATGTGFGGSRDVALPDGLEVTGGQIGITQIGQATTNINSVCLMGFEY